MAYNRKNHIRKQLHALTVTEQYYEPGRQDRCYRWVWQKYIRDQFHIEYDTYLRWIRAAKKYRLQQADATKSQLPLW